MSGESLRIDKWLWYARFFKTRVLATETVKSGKVRVNGSPVSKPARVIVAGDVLTFPKETDIRVIKVVALGERRGPAPEAQALYEDLEPPQPKPKNPNAVVPNPKYEGKGRPTKKDRRNLRLNSPFDA